MRLIDIRSFSLVAFALLIGWEFWKAVSINEPDQDEVEHEMKQLRHFDDYSLINEHLLTTYPQDIEFAAIQRIRKQVVSSHCHKRKKSEIFPLGSNLKKGINSNAFRNILVSDKHQLLYCVTPKIACTNWKRVLLILDGYFKKPDEIGSSLAHNFSTGYFRKLSDYSPDEINLRLTTYYKFLFARHPYERLTSAFRNKFIEAKYKTFKIIFGKYIMRKYRDPKNLTQDKRYHEGEGVTFQEFVKFIIDSPLENQDFWNEHWERIDRLCLPCLIQYDFVGKFESMKQDADYLLRTLDVSDQVTFPGNRPSNADVLMKEYFKSVSKEMKDKLYDLYKHDFLMFNYKRPTFEDT